MTSAEKFIAMYSSSKLKHPAAILLLQKQREYIAYEPDAKIASAVLGIDMEASMQGMPPSVSIGCQNLQKALRNLLNKGHMVAVGRKSKKKDPILSELNIVKVDIELYIMDAGDN